MISRILNACLLVGTLLQVTSGLFLVGDFPVNLTCVSHVPPMTGKQVTFRCTWLPPQNDSMEHCSLFFRAIDEFNWEHCKSLAKWNLCDVLRKGPACKVPKDHCSFEHISLMLSCENHIKNFTSAEFSIHNIVIPNPPSGLHLIATAKGRMGLSWEWPSGWSEFDLHELKFNVQYWQEVGGKQLSMNTILIDIERSDTSDIIPWDLSGLEYSYIYTCVQMSSIYKTNVNDHPSNWSAVVCNRTQMERPTGKPENLTAWTLFHDVRMGTRKVIVSWTPIPEIEQGGPIQYYEVNIGLSESVTTQNISGCFIVFNELNATRDYHIRVAAWNEVGCSTYATFFLRRLESPNKVSATSKYLMLVGVILFLFIILIVIISSLLVCRRKLKEGSDVEWKLNVTVPDESALSQGNVLTIEKEVFDELTEKKEPNNNESAESTDITKEQSCQEEEEYQPFIAEKNGGLTSYSQCSYLEAESTGYVDAEGLSDGKVNANLMSEDVSDGKMVVDLKSVDENDSSKYLAEDFEQLYIQL